MRIFYPLESNCELIRKIFGNKFYQNMLDDRLSSDECIMANNTLAEILYGQDIYKALNNDDVLYIKNKVELIRNNFKKRVNYIRDFDTDCFGMLFIRPENVQAVDSYIKFLEDRGLNVIYKTKTRISFDQYLSMYYHGLIPKESRYDFPTRTLNYINKDCYLLVVYSDNENIYPVSDYLTSIKGKQGKYTEGTLRGDVAYNLLKEFVSSDGLSFSDNNLNLLFDPIGMSRLLVRNQIESDNSHNIADLKLLFYTGQAVHVPDSSEFVRDFSTICNDNEVDEVFSKVFVKKK